jgi:hypothetical protein
MARFQTPGGGRLEAAKAALEEEGDPQAQLRADVNALGEVVGGLVQRLEELDARLAPLFEAEEPEPEAEAEEAPAKKKKKG